MKSQVRLCNTHSTSRLFAPANSRSHHHTALVVASHGKLLLSLATDSHLASGLELSQLVTSLSAHQSGISWTCIIYPVRQQHNLLKTRTERILRRRSWITSNTLRVACFTGRLETSWPVSIVTSSPRVSSRIYPPCCGLVWLYLGRSDFSKSTTWTSDSP